MAENATINIDILVNAAEAQSGIATADKALALLAEQCAETGHDFENLTDDIDAVAKQLSDQLGISVGDAKKSLKKLKAGTDDGLKGMGSLKVGADDGAKSLDNLKGQAGEVSSSFGQFGAAAGVLNPELGAMASRVGALAGGLEGAAKMTKLTGGSMKSLARIGGVAGVAIVALGSAWFVFSKRLKTANETLAQSNQKMIEGIAKAKAYGARMDVLRMKVGLLTSAQLDERESRREATELMDMHAVQFKRDLELRSASTTAIRMNNEALSELDVTSRLNVHRVVTLQEAIDATNESIENQVNTIGDAVLEAHTGAEAAARYREENALLQSTIDSASLGIERYNAGHAKHNAILMISKAIASGNVDQMKESAFFLGALEGAELRMIETNLMQALAMQEETEAMEANAKALEGRKVATDEAATADTEAAEKLALRAEALDRIATATGEASAIEREYQKELAAIADLLDKGAASEEEAAIMRQGALAVQTGALQDLKQAKDDALAEDADRLDQMRALALTETQAIVDQFDTQIKELEDARSEDVTNKAAYDAKIVALEEEKSERLRALALATAERQIQTANMVSGLVGGLVQAQMDRINQKLDQEKAAALERAGDDLDAQAKIEAEFAARRKKDLAKSWKLQKGLEAANAITSAASATVAALSAPPTGLGPVFGPALFPLIAGTLGLQLSTILGQQPAFHSGGVVGGGPGSDQTITAQQGEVVLSRSAVARMGGQAQADGWNAPGGQPGPLVIELTYRQRVFDRVVVDSLAKGGPLKKAIKGAAKTGKRGRIGGRL